MTKTERINLKAKELVNKIGGKIHINDRADPKELAILCIEEQLKMLSNIDTSFNDGVAEEVYQAENELELIKERINI